MGRPIRVILAAIALIATALTVAPAPQALAQSTDRIAVNLDDTGVFVETGADGAIEDFRAVIDRLGAAGLNLLIVSLAEDDPNIESLARDLRDRTGGTVLVITPQQLAAASDSFSDAEVGRAIDRSLIGFDSGVVAGALSFGESLIGSSAPTATTTAGAPASATTAAPAAGGTTSAPTESSGSGRGLLIFLLVVVVAIVGLVMFTRNKNRKRVETELEARRSVVSEELEDIGVEIVSLSDAMSISEDDETTKHFRKANADFLDLKERLTAASSLWQVTEIDNEADTTAWHLDAAAALLAGKPVPEKPAQQAAAPPVDSSGKAPPAASNSSDLESRRSERNKVDSRLDDRRRGPSSTPSPRQQNRQRRRDSWKPPKLAGGGLGGILTSVLIGGVLGGGGSSRPPKGWSGAGTVTGSTRSGSRRRGNTSGRRSGSASRRRSGGSATRSRRRSSGGSASRRR